MKNETDALNEAIMALHEKRVKELGLLKEQLHTTYESLKPINIIKSTFNEVTQSTELKNNLFDNAIGLATGFVSKKIWVGGSHNPIRRLFGTLIQFAIANVVSKNSDSIKSTGEHLLHRFLKRINKSDKEFQSNGHDQFIDG